MKLLVYPFLYSTILLCTHLLQKLALFRTIVQRNQIILLLILPRILTVVLLAFGLIMFLLPGCWCFVSHQYWFSFRSC